MRFNFHESQRIEKVRAVKAEWDTLMKKESNRLEEFGKKRESALSAVGKDNVMSFAVRNVFDAVMGSSTKSKKKTEANPEFVLLE